MKKIFLIAVVIILSIASFAQRPGQRNMGERPKIGTVTGKIIDSSTNELMEYANIALYSKRDSSLITGTITDSKGNFTIKEVPLGRFYLTANFIGYNKQYVNDIKIMPNAKTAQLGTIKLNTASTDIDEVTVTAEKSHINYKLDRKVINVSQDINSTGATAVEVLENTPSITVDIEGNVALRGSSNFTVLIDGKPSVLDGSDALQQIPSSTIENIEIITNPSAKYDPDGIGGIINVILKKNTGGGLNGISNISGSSNGSYKTDILLNYKTSKYNLFGSVDYNKMNRNGTFDSKNENYYTDSTFFRHSNGDREMYRDGLVFKTGGDYYINDNITLSTALNYGNYEFTRGGDTDIQTWYNTDINRDYSINNNNSIRSGNYYSANINYDQKFDDNGHKLSALIYYSARTGDDSENQETILSNNQWENLGSENKIKSKSSDSHDDYRIKIDYTKPVIGGKIETGLQSRLRSNDEDYKYFEFDQLNNEWNTIDAFTNNIHFKRDIHSAYFTFANKIIGIEYQLGLRGEYTNREIKNTRIGESYIIDRFDYFPTVHLSKQLSKTTQLQTSYSKRINRPRGWFLDPVPGYMDEYNTRQGNPSLEPEYINSFELGFQQSIGKSFINIEGYYRTTENKITRIRTLQTDNSFLHTFENLNNDYALGIEFMANYTPVKWLNINATTNIYKYEIESDLIEDGADVSSKNLDFRVNTTFKFAKNTRIQVNTFYRGPTVSVQGTREGFLATSLALRQDFFDKKMTATLNVRDIFGQMKHEFTSEGENFYSWDKFAMDTPIASLSLSYKINNYKNHRKKSEEMDLDFESDY